MMRPGLHSVLVGLLVLFGARWGAQAEATNPAPDFKEVYELLRAHAGDMSEAELNRAAVQALVSALEPRVSLVTNTEREPALAGPLVTRTSLFEGDIAYLRIGRVADGSVTAVREAYDHVGATNKLRGLVLDLRFADGEDYAAAAGVADLFVKQERPLLNWGESQARSKAKTDAISVPVAVLVNRQTAGAAEALAAVIRDTGVGLILGGRTAGQATMAQEYPLRNGARLRIATAPIRLGDGSSLPSEGLKPDIKVEVRPEEERAYYTDAFKAPSRTNLAAGVAPGVTNAPGTNRTARRTRFNEAELVRERREGASREADEAGSRDHEPDQPVVYDPALARALDLLKGLALVRPSRS